MIIKCTKNYEKFNFLHGNRKVKTRHVKELKEAIIDEDLSQYHPIIVNQDMKIIDGQHRLMALMELKKPIYYTVGKLELREVQKLNSIQMNWNYEDYLQSYGDLGLNDYRVLSRFRDKWKFKISECLVLLTGKHSRPSGMYKDFKDGNFRVKSLDKAEELAKKNL